MDLGTGIRNTFDTITWQHLGLTLTILAAASLLSFILRRAVRRIAESTSPRFRLGILRTLPLTRLFIAVAATTIVLSLYIVPTLANTIAVAASLGLGIAFALKDYVSSLLAGILTILENTYQPGDWIDFAGTYGEVTCIELRATRLLTADDTVVIVPNSRFWSSNVANATSGHRGLLCIVSFYLHPEHDAAAVQAQLLLLATSSPQWDPDSKVSVVVTEQPWGTKYRLKAYVKESREQFAFITDLTLRGKEALRRLGVQFALATPVAQSSH